MKKTTSKSFRGRKQHAGSAKKARRHTVALTLREGKRPELPETHPERVWEKVNPLLSRFHHTEPTMEEMVAFLAEYHDELPLRDFITGLAVQWLGVDVKVVKRRGASRPTPSERIRLTVPDILDGLIRSYWFNDATFDELLDDVALAWLKHGGSHVVDRQVREQVQAERERQRTERARQSGRG